MKKRAVEFVVGAILLAAVMLTSSCAGSPLPKFGDALDASGSVLSSVCAEETPRCAKAAELFAIAKAAYDRAVAADAAGDPDAAALIDQAAKAVEDLLRVLKTL